MKVLASTLPPNPNGRPRGPCSTNQSCFFQYMFNIGYNPQQDAHSSRLSNEGLQPSPPFQSVCTVVTRSPFLLRSFHLLPVLYVPLIESIEQPPCHNALSTPHCPSIAMTGSFFLSSETHFFGVAPSRHSSRRRQGAWGVSSAGYSSDSSVAKTLNTMPITPFIRTAPSCDPQAWEAKRRGCW